MCSYGIEWLIPALLLSLAVSVYSQGSMDPVVRITETDPPSDGHRVRGTIARDVVLNCYVENLPSDLQVRWQRSMFDKDGRETVQDISKDMDVQDNMKWSIEKPTLYTWRLRIRAMTLQDEGNYTCFVRLTSNNNRAEANRTVFATEPPDIIEALSSSNIYAREGDFVAIRCNASGRPIPTVIFRREGNAILPTGGVELIGGKLDIQNVQFRDRGRYICDALNEVGTARREIILSVQHAPKVNPDPPQPMQAVGYQRTLTCHVDANPQPSLDWDTNQLSWIKGNLRINTDARREIRAIQGAYNRITYELRISPVQEEDYGVYTCRARTNLGTGSTTVELVKTDEPQPDKGRLSAASHLLVSMTTFIFSVWVATWSLL